MNSFLEYVAETGSTNVVFHGVLVSSLLFELTYSRFRFLERSITQTHAAYKKIQLQRCALGYVELPQFLPSNVFRSIMSNRKRRQVTGKIILIL